MRNSIKQAVFTIVAIVATIGFVANAATKGDQFPFGFNDIAQVCGYDGGTGSWVSIPVKSNQNAVAVRNFINDGGTSNTVFCGFDNTQQPLQGMPVMSQESLNLDIVALTQNAVSAKSDSLTDGGVVLTAGSVKPNLYCVELAGATCTDLHWMVTK